MAEPWTTDTIREAFIYDGGESAYYDPVNGEREHRRIAGDIFDAWLTAHDARKRAEWEAEGRRWYAACWRDDNGVLNELESETVVREYAEADVKRWRNAEEGEPDGQPDRVILATKIERPWVPVDENEATNRENGSNQ